MKILIVANTDWYLFRFRLSLARFLRGQGMEVVLASPFGPYVSQLEAEGFRWLAWEVGRQSVNPLREVGAIWNLFRMIRRERPDLIHLHTIKPVLYGSLGAWLGKTPAVVRSITGRGYVFLGNDLRARLLKLLVMAIYRFALGAGRGMTIFENEADRNFFVEQKLVTPANSCIIEGAGVDTDHYLSCWPGACCGIKAWALSSRRRGFCVPKSPPALFWSGSQMWETRPASRSRY
jgi:hypothetical protein